MNDQKPSSDYLLFFRSTVWDAAMTPEELGQAIARLDTWFEELSARGQTDGGMRLSVDGRVVRCHQGRFISDGPFVESKEAVGGYVHVRARGMEEAVSIAQGWPGLEFGLSVEIRPVVPACPVALRPQT